jgi:CDP-4-dehydro-6-deoxyglucose reductase, E3
MIKHRYDNLTRANAIWVGTAFALFPAAYKQPITTINGVFAISAMPNMQLLVGSEALSVPIDARSTLLEQVLPLGLAVNYSCLRGDCGQCVGTLVGGTVEPKDNTKPCLSGSDLYLCNALSRSDLTVRLPYCEETAHLRILRSPCKIQEINRLSGGVTSLTLRLPPSSGWSFVPGQYVRLTNADRVTRSYSLAEPPRPDKGLVIHVRRQAGGRFSEYLDTRGKIGDLLHIEGPMGRFVLPERATVSKTIFLATGVGIAPVHAILSMLVSAPKRNCGELFLYWGNRLRSDAYLHARLEELARMQRLSYTPIFSREHGSGVGPAHVQDQMVLDHQDLEQAQVYACGSAAMIEDARKRCESMRLPADRFVADPFTAS